MASPDLTRFWIGADRTNIDQRKIPFSSLSDNGNRVGFGVKWQAPGKFSIKAYIDSNTEFTTLGGNVPASQVGSEQAYFVTLPKGALTEASHILRVQMFDPSGGISNGQAVFELYTPEAAGGGAAPPPGEQPPLPVDIAALWSGLGYYFDKVWIDGKVFIDTGILCTPLEIDEKLPHTVSARIFGKTQSSDLIPRGNAARTQPLPVLLSIYIDGKPAVYGQLDQPPDRASIDNIAAVIPANTLSRGPHQLGVGISLNVEGAENYEKRTKDCTITVKGVAARTITIGAPATMEAGGSANISVEVLNDGQPSIGEPVTISVDGVTLATTPTVNGKVVFIYQDQDFAPGSVTICAKVPATPAAGAAEKCATITIISTTKGRPINLVVPKTVIDGRNVEIAVQVYCGTSLSNGETAIFTVDREEIGRVMTENGVARVTWKATVVPSRYHKVCARIPVSDKCPKVGEGYTCEAITVSREGTAVLEQLAAEEEERAAAGFVPAAPKVGKVLTIGEAIQLIGGVPSPGLNIPIEIPTPPEVPAPTPPEVTPPTEEQPVPNVGAIVIPGVSVPIKFAEIPVTITIDGDVIGAPPLSRAVLAGKHRIKIEVKGLAPLYRTVTVESGETQVLSDLALR